VKTVVVAHGDVAASDRDEAASADMVIAADGGALALERWGIVPQLVVGDLDSLGEKRAAQLGRLGAKVVEFPAAKDESDLELALRHALATGADDIVLLGIFAGARLDHALANAMLVADPAYRGTGLRAVFGTTQVRAIHSGEGLDLDAPAGTTVTLLPVGGDATGVRTTGLRYPLDDETLRFGRSRGLSNVVTARAASVSIENGILLVIEIRDGGQS
jgi:thiamine pyrophosphokinase